LLQPEARYPFFKPKEMVLNCLKLIFTGLISQIGGESMINPDLLIAKNFLPKSQTYYKALIPLD